MTTGRGHPHARAGEFSARDPLANPPSSVDGDRRQDDRFANAGSVLLVILDARGRPQPPLQFEAEDISSGGLRLRGRHIVHPGSIGAVQLSGSDGSPMMAGVRAAWRQKIGQAEHLVGFEFQPAPSAIKPAHFAVERDRTAVVDESRTAAADNRAPNGSSDDGAASKPVGSAADEDGFLPRQMPIDGRIDEADNRRSAPRHRYSGWCAIVLLEKSGVCREPVVLQAVDLSAGGLALRSPWMAHTGTIGAVQMLKADGSTTVRGVRVQWCRYHGQMEHILGLKFIPLDPRIRERAFQNKKGQCILLDPKYAGGAIKRWKTA